MPELTAEQIAEAQIRAQQEYYLRETNNLLELAKNARAVCLAASPQVEPVRVLLYQNFMACARVFYREEPKVTAKQEDLKSGAVVVVKGDENVN